MSINQSILKKYSTAFIIYEIATHGVDPRETLEGTVMRIDEDEGYKYREYDKGRVLLSQCASYTNAIIRALPGYNLVDRFQKEKIVGIIKAKGPDNLENALKLLFDENDDERAFMRIKEAIGGSFDVLGFIFFLKDCSKYLPIRSHNFDQRFDLLGIESNLAGNCSWEKYTQYLCWINEIKDYLNAAINKNITLLDAHSFLWILPGLHEYLESHVQMVEHKSFGKGVVAEIDDTNIVVKFPSGKRTLDKKTVLDKDLLTFIKPDFDIDKDSKSEQPEDKGKEAHAWGTYASWTVKNDEIAIKQCDKSFFEYHGATIPHEIYWFFHAQGMQTGSKKSITLRYLGNEYEAYIQRETLELARIRVFWGQNLATQFGEYNVPGHYPKLVFIKKNEDYYEVAFEEANLNKKAIEVAEALLHLIANRTRLTTYGELSDMTESKPSPYYEMRMYLDAINKRCDKLALPHISAMVVNKSTGLPGEGFRDLCISSFGYDPQMTTQEIFDAELDKIGKCDQWKRLADSLGIIMPEGEEEPLPEEIEDETGTPIIEGAKRTITVNSYERDPKAKKVCKDYYMKRDGRITCQVCGFDFGKVYGSEYANKIHVHHIVPVSEIGEEYVVDPVKDLIPVCPNCHMVLHVGKGISIEELRKRIIDTNHTKS